MSNFTYSLDIASYSWQSAALFWGNFIGHCSKANEGSLSDRVIHILIAAIEFLPIISQISSIFEKLIIDNFSLPSETDLLIGKQISIETDNEKYKNFPAPSTSIDNENESSEIYKASLLSLLSKTIESQQKHKTYKRVKLAHLLEQGSNLPIPLSFFPNKVKYFSENAIFFSYNTEGIRDYGWGCAWRAIQTCLSAYNINPSFEELFHLFGPFENLERIYENKYAEELSNSKLFAPYDLSLGWAEPFIGHMVMHFYNIPSTLETVNGIPGSCKAPQHVFHNKSLSFNTFKESLENHFNTGTAAPVMIDDGIYALNIVGIETEELNTILWIADPHIKEGVNKLIDEEKSPAGLYKITLDDTGKQIHCSLTDDDNHQMSNMFSAGSYKGLHFDSKRWMVLFPLNTDT